MGKGDFFRNLLVVRVDHLRVREVRDIEVPAGLPEGLEHLLWRHLGLFRLLWFLEQWHVYPCKEAVALPIINVSG